MNGIELGRLRSRSKSKDGPDNNRWEKPADLFSPTVMLQGLLSREIKVMAEVEKIWITYDADKNGWLDYGEVKNYLK